jgi:large subunit ribosomal protein L16
MVLFTDKTKYKKYFKGKDRFFGIDNRYILPNVGAHGLKVKFSGRVTNEQIESAKKIIKKKISKRVKESLFLTFFPDLPITRKSSGLRMGKGKGNIETWTFPINSVRIIFELSNIIKSYLAFIALKKGSYKIGKSRRFVSFSL